MTFFIQEVITGVCVGGIYALIATGYSLIYSLLDFSNWAHGEVCMLGAYLAWIMVSRMSLPFQIAAVLGIVFAAVMSYLNERVAYRRIRHNGSPNMFLMIAAMGLSTTYQNVANIYFTAKYQTFNLPLQNSTIEIPLGASNVYIGVLDLICLGVTSVALIALIFLINHTKFGLNSRAVACNRHAAAVLGIKIDRTIASVFLMAGALAGIAGILLGVKYNVYPTMGNIGLKAFIASVIGGLGSIPGAIIGALILGILETMVSGYINSGLRDLISFALLVVLLIVKPSGIMGVSVEEKA